MAIIGKGITNNLSFIYLETSLTHQLGSKRSKRPLECNSI